VTVCRRSWCSMCVVVLRSVGQSVAERTAAVASVVPRRADWQTAAVADEAAAAEVGDWAHRMHRCEHIQRNATKSAEGSDCTMSEALQAEASACLSRLSTLYSMNKPAVMLTSVPTVCHAELAAAPVATARRGSARDSVPARTPRRRTPAAGSSLDGYPCECVRMDPSRVEQRAARNHRRRIAWLSCLPREERVDDAKVRQSERR
jgi:hypothetical protein